MEQRQLDRRIPRHRLLHSAAAVLALATCAIVPFKAEAEVSVGVGISVGVPPPPLPVYVQPAIPAPGYIWVPGYWAYGDGGYFWVPGTWILPPYVGALWTPGYWGWSGGVYVFHGGYWGPHVGFYGGINYGFGYTGVGYVGGYWHNGGFYYNRSVNHIDNVHITNVYNRTVNHVTVNRASFNGGQGGIAARPSAQEMSFARERHVAPLTAQEHQRMLASQNQAMRASFNHGAPPIAATARPGAFNGQGAGTAHGVASSTFAPAAAAAQHANAPVQGPHNDMALHSSGFAPHANGGAQPAAGRVHSAGGYQPSASHAAYQPQTARTNSNHPANTSRPANSYHPASHAPTYQAAAHPAPASHVATHPSGGGHAAPAGHPGVEHR